jgi:hypothetical protein
MLRHLDKSCTSPKENAMPSNQTDFDFLHGVWNVRHRRLTERLKGSDAWEEFSGTSTTRPIMGGMGNLEDNMLNFPGGAYKAVALRSFDSAHGLWAIWWLDGRNPHALDVPVVGLFSDGVGTFLADDTFEGKLIKVRFVWRHESADSCRWEQAFSADGGTTWETNWVMDFTRAE